MNVAITLLPFHVTKISIRQPCLSFAVYSSHMLPRQLDVLLVSEYLYKISMQEGRILK